MTLYPASLVGVTEHNDMLLEVLNLPVSRNVVELVVEVVTDAVDHAFSRPGPSRGRSLHRQNQSFHDFVSRVLANADTPMATVLLTLAYIKRAKRYLQIALEDWACERVFLGALVVAAKYSNDSTLKNKHWAQCTQVFSTADVSRVEREFLDVMAFELSITEAELLPLITDIAASSRDTIKAQRKHKLPPIPLKPKQLLQQDADAAVTARRAAREASRAECQGCPELSPCSSPASDATAASPATPPPATPPMVASAPSHPPGIPYPNAKGSNVGPERGRSPRKRVSPISRPRSFAPLQSVKAALHLSLLHHSKPAPSSSHSSATPSPDEPSSRPARVAAGFF